MIEFKNIIEWLHPVIEIIDLISGLVLVGGFVVGVTKFTSIIFMENQKKFKAYQMLRRTTGIYIILGLEFMIIADILETLLDHSITNMLSLGLIVTIRTILSYFLGKEMSEAKEEILAVEEILQAEETKPEHAK